MENFKGCRVHWFYGKTGTGKTHAMYEAFRSMHLKYNEAFDGDTKCKTGYYLDHAKDKNIKVVYFDNVFYEQDDHLKLRDITNFINGSYIRVKGEGYVYMQPEEIYITSLWKPEELYEKYRDKEDKGYKNLIDHIVELREFKIDEYKEHIEYEKLKEKN